jgi:hypothetical protein
MGMDRERRLLQQESPNDEDVRQRQEIEADIVDKRPAVSLDMRIDRDKPHHVDHDQGPTKLRPKNPHSARAHMGQRLRSAAGVNALD